MSLFSILPVYWRDSTTPEICARVDAAIGWATTVPDRSMVFRAFEIRPEDVKVVLLGQDPFIKPGEAVGLSFSVPRGFKVPPSTAAIYRCLYAQGLMTEVPKHGDLSAWARQGVLMLNTSLTTRMGRSGAHTALWEEWRQIALPYIAAACPRAIWILLGSHAQDAVKGLPISNALHWGHPSPLNAANRVPGPKNFTNCTVFRAANDILVSQGREPINWDPDADITVAPINVAPVTDTVADAVTDAVTEETHTNTTPLVVAPADTQTDAVVVGAETTTADAPIGTQTDDTAAAVTVVAPVAARTCKYPPLTRAQRAIYPRATPTLSDEPDLLDGDDPEYATGTLYLFTDGGTLGNGCDDSVGAYGYMLNNGIYKYLGSGKLGAGVTNNRAELLAMLHGIEKLEQDIEIWDAKTLYVFSDSKYAIGCAAKWGASWRKTGAKKANLDIVYPLLDKLEAIRAAGIQVVFNHVRGHGADPADCKSLAWWVWYGNQICDLMCRRHLEA